MSKVIVPSVKKRLIIAEKFLKLIFHDFFLDNGSDLDTMPPVGAQVAQSVEQGTENPRVGSSILSLGTTFPDDFPDIVFRILID